MILIINICRDSLHYFEFVRPVENILKENGFEFLTAHYKNLKEEYIKRADKIIICGTSLADNEFINDLDLFRFLLTFGKPVLGICGGAHIIGLLLGHKLQKNEQIGISRVKINSFLGFNGEAEVYHLHQYRVLPEIFHKDHFYATLFHPEVRNKEMIVNFSRLN